MTAQLDLFADSQAVRLVNEVIAALERRDAQAAAAGLGALRSYDPAHADLHVLGYLTDAVAAWRAPAPEAPAIAAAVHLLETQLAPAAQRAMGAAAGPFVRAFYLQLADVARDLPYSKSHPKAHRAWLSLQCADWAEAELAAQAIPGAGTTPDALHWLACARYRSRGLEAARPALFALAWHAPQRLASVLAELQDELLDRDWQRFAGACDWDSVSDAELPAWFPAWYLLEHPAVRDELDYFNAPRTPPAEAARLLRHLLDLERRGDWRKLTTSREKLRRLNGELFGLYMERRSVRLL
jgi:hypothetical protein